MRFPLTFAAIMTAFLAWTPDGKSQATTYSAPELIAAVKAAKPPGSQYARIRIEYKDSAGSTTLQVQVKRHPTGKDSSEALLQVLFPKDRKGEGIMLKVRGTHFTGSTYDAAKGVQPLKADDADATVFRTGLTIGDLTASFLYWPSHQTVGQENIGNVACTVIESRPGTAKTGPYVKSWIDTTRYAPMRIEIFGANGKAVKNVVTDKVMRGDSGYFSPVSFTVTDLATGSVTKVEGVRANDDVNYTEADFTDAALQQVTGPGGS